MFEVSVDSLDAVGCADALVETVELQRQLGAQRLALVAAWADQHGPDEETTTRPRHGRPAARPGGHDGTPLVQELAAVELGMHLQISTGSARALVSSTLDLRHRHPRLWRDVMAGEVDDWKARRVAALCAPLTAAQAHDVDARTEGVLTGLAFGNAMTVVEGAMVAADPVGHERRRAEAAQRRYVSKSRKDNPYGLRTLVAQTTSGDVARLDAMVAHLAQLLLAAGDTDPLQVRRAKALGLLANPALACVFLARATDERAAAHEAQAAVDHECAGRGGCGCPADEVTWTREREPEPEPAAPAAPTAVDLALELGRLLDSRGSVVLDRLRPRTVLHVHVAAESVLNGPASGAEVVRVEGLGPISPAQLREWLAGPAGSGPPGDSVIVRPVLDPLGPAPVSAYEVPGRMREALQLLQPIEILPFGTRESRGTDADHTRPYVPPERGGPPGQTRLDNLGPLGRTGHRAKTHGGFVCHQPLPGMYLWRTPTGHWFHVDSQGTRPLGRRTPEILRQRGEVTSPTEGAFRRLLAA